MTTPNDWHEHNWIGGARSPVFICGGGAVSYSDQRPSSASSLIKQSTVMYILPPILISLISPRIYFGSRIWFDIRIPFIISFILMYFNLGFILYFGHLNFVRSPSIVLRVIIYVERARDHSRTPVWPALNYDSIFVCLFFDGWRTEIHSHVFLRIYFSIRISQVWIIMRIRFYSASDELCRSIVSMGYYLANTGSCSSNNFERIKT